MVANVFQPLGQDVDRVFGSAADWVGDGRGGLSDRLWLARKLDRDAIDKILRVGLMTGADPLQVARQLEDYLTPVGQKTTTRTPRSGKGNAAARTLARTETSHAFNQASIDAAKLNPFVYGMRWLISGRHPKSDQCDQNAHNSSRGFPPGVYRFGDFPQIPAHPNCLCVAAPEAVDDDAAVLDQLRQGLGIAANEASIGESSISRAVTLPDGPLGDRLRPALDAIDSVHTTPGLPHIDVKRLTRRDAQATYEFDVQTFKPKFIGATDRAAEAELGLVHEVGHAIDHQLLGRHPGWFGSASPRGTDLDAWEGAVLDSRAAQSLLRLRLGGNISLPLSDGSVYEFAPDDVYTNYLLDRTELFARSYSQWIARRSGNPLLNAQLEKVRRQGIESGYTEFWDDADFEPIGAALDSAFRAKGLMP